MKCAARFEKLLHERRASETTRDMNDKELLEDIVAKYNGYKATAALKRWQIGPEGVNALLAVICGMCPEARQLVRMHLDFNKYEESGCLPISIFYLKFSDWFRLLFIRFWFVSFWFCHNVSTWGYNEALLRNKRHQLNESPKGLSPFWQDLLSVSVLNSDKFCLFELGFLLRRFLWMSWLPSHFAAATGDQWKPSSPLPEITLLVGVECKEGKEVCSQSASLEWRGLGKECRSVLPLCLGYAAVQNKSSGPMVLFQKIFSWCDVFNVF